jgi:hypothetical protein
MIVRFSTIVSVLLCPIITLAASGCSQGDLPELGEVSGTVTMDGQPLSGVWVGFAPTEGRSSMALTDAQGHYELIYLDGAPGAKIGTHKVAITTPQEDEFGGQVKNWKERVPAAYNSKTILTADVKAGSNTIDFPLTKNGAPPK